MASTSEFSRLEKGARIDRTFECSIKNIDAENYTVDVLVSDASIDRHEEIILPSAYAARIAHYLANPILCWGHPLNKEDGADPEDCIGKAISVRVQPEGLFCTFQYAVAENDRAALIWRLVSGGYLKAFSIGAIVWDCIYCFDSQQMLDTLPTPAQESMKAGACWCVITDCELVEVSQVFVGSCRSALLKAMSEGKVSREMVSKALRPRIAHKIAMSENPIADFADFLEAMIPHHELALTMSNDYLSLPSADRSSPVDDLAHSIIKSQTAEIGTMKQILAENQTTEEKSLQFSLEKSEASEVVAIVPPAAPVAPPEASPALPDPTPEPTEDEQLEALLDSSPELAEAFAEIIAELLEDLL